MQNYRAFINASISAAQQIYHPKIPYVSVFTGLIGFVLQNMLNLNHIKTGL